MGFIFSTPGVTQIYQGTVLEIWNFKRKQELMDLGILRLDEVKQDRLKFKEGDEGLSHSQRQWMQVSMQWPGGGAFYLDRQLISSEMAGWQFPLHFTDFDTARVVIPFFAGQRP